MVRPKSKSPRNKDINIRLKQSELDMIQYVSDALEVSRTDSIVLSVKYLITAAKARYKRKGGYRKMLYKTIEEIEKAKEAELEEWRQSIRQEEYEKLEKEVNGSIDEFESEWRIEEYIEEQKEKIEEYIEEREPDVAEKIDEEYERYVEEVEGAEEELKEYVHRLIFG